MAAHILSISSPPSLLLLFLLLLLLAHHITPSLSAVPRFGAVDHGGFPLPGAGGGGGGDLAPRWYMDAGTPLVPAPPASPNPRFGLRASWIGGRQGNPCDPGSHSCVEVGKPGFCCPNDRYCYLNSTWGAGCCSLGVQCEDSPCDADHLYCTTTATRTVSFTTVTEPDGAVQVTATTTLVVSTGCCNRACSASFFSCEKAFGGQCCEYGYKCATGDNCIYDPAPSSTGAISTIVTPVPPGCTTSQFSCAASEGGGCCNVGSVCTFQHAGAPTLKAVCSPEPTSADGGSGGSSGALSKDARVGIGVGVSVGAAAVIAAATWLCLRKRRGRPATVTSAHEMSQNARFDDIGGMGSGSRMTEEDRELRSSLFPNQTTPYTDIAQPDIGNRVFDGPEPGRGPFTAPDHGDLDQIHDPARASIYRASPPALFDENYEALRYGSVPYDPDHIGRGPARAGIAEAPEDPGDKGGGHAGHQEETPAHGTEQPGGPFELVGSLPVASQLHSDDVRDRRLPSPPSPGAELK